jgi:hypoxanthine phosphoribosyltransferase
MDDDLYDSLGLGEPSRQRDILDVDWPLFGELCRALALKVAAEFDPEIVVGIAKAGVIPGAVIASMLQRDFASMAVSRLGTRKRPTLVTEPPPSIRGLRVLIVDETCDTGDTLKLALSAVRKHAPAAVHSAVSFRTGSYRPDFYALGTENEIVLPWEHDVLIGGREITTEEYRDKQREEGT